MAGMQETFKHTNPTNFQSAMGRREVSCNEGVSCTQRKQVKMVKEEIFFRERSTGHVQWCFIADQELNEIFISNPKCYGGIIINDEERAVLSLQPKFTVYEKIQPTQCEAEIEKSLTNIRFSRIRSSQEPNNEQLTRTPLFDFETKTFDWRNVRSTILPFNSNVHIPNPLPQIQEIALQNLKQELLSITYKYSENNNIT